MKSCRLRPILPSDFKAICKLSDAAFGDNYITPDELKRQWPLMTQENQSASFLLTDSDEEPLGFRITFLPGTWLEEKEAKKCLVNRWSISPEGVGYFKTAFVDRSLRGQGWGRKMAEKAIEVIQSLGGTAIVTHSWNESPGDSSGKYLRALGFQQVGKIPGFWGEATYACVECNTKPCTCSATEMILEI